MSAPEQRWVLVPANEHQPRVYAISAAGTRYQFSSEADRDAFIASRLPGSGFEAVPCAAPKPSDEDLERAFRAGQRALNDIRYRRAAQMISGTFKEGDPADAMLEDAKVCLRAALDALGA